MANSVLHPPRYPHFFQPLLPDFHSHLSIPLKFFLEHIEGRYEKNTVELESDACESTWKVRMEGRRLTVGWKEFTIAHDFRIGDIIIFRHEGDLVFHVTSFGPSCCEIQHVKDNIGNLSTKQNVKAEPESSQDDDEIDNMENPPGKKHAKKRIHEEKTVSFRSDQSCFVAHITDSNLREDTLFLPRKFVRPDGLKKSSNKISLVNEGERAWTLILKFRESSRTFYMRGGWRSFCHENRLKPGDSVMFKLERTYTRTPLLRLSTLESKKVSTKYSNKGKRKITGESSERVSLSSSSSSSSLSQNRFVTLTVWPANLTYNRIYLPTSFTRVNRMETAGGRIITMLDKDGVNWPVNLFMEKDARMRLGSGLTEFLKANGVKVYESFVLELVWEDTTSPPMLKFCSKIKT